MSVWLATLVLRDVQLPATPALWPPAPGWWLLAALLAVLLGGLCLWLWQRRAQRERWARQFDELIQPAETPLARVRLASELLRRAALVHAPSAARLDGQAWRDWLQAGQKGDPLAVAVLAEGVYRPALDAGSAEAACALARRRFVALMVGQ